MEQDNRTAGTGQDRTEQDTIVSVADAAVVLGVSTDAVRKRIRRGQLTAQKVGAQWFVVLDERPVARQDRTKSAFGTRQDKPVSRPETGQDRTGQPVVISGAAQAQLEAIRDEWLAPLVAQISDQAETIGRVTAERDALQRRVDTLEARQRSAREMTVLRTIHPDHTPETATGERWWRFWVR